MSKHAVFCAVAVAVSSCAPAPTSEAPGIVHTPCAPLVVSLDHPTALQRAGAEGAVAIWNTRGFTRLSLEGSGEPIAVRFQSAAGFFHGVYDPDTGEVTINSTLDVEGELQVVIAHELGHAMGLVHVEPGERASVMNPGNLWVPPTPADSAQLSSGCAEP